MTGQTVPMLSPEGEVGDVPQENVNDAVNKGGFKIAQEMLSPDGEEGVIPLEQVHAAIAKGFRPKRPTATVGTSQPQQEEEQQSRAVRPTDSEENPLSNWDNFKAWMGDKAAAVGNKVLQMAGHAQETAPDLGKRAYDLTAPGVLTEVWKHMHGQPNRLHQIPGDMVMAFLMAGGMPEAAEGIEAGEVGEAGEAASAAKVPAPNIVRGEVHNAIAKASQNVEENGEIVRMVGEDGQTYDVPQSEVEALDQYRAGHPYKVHEPGGTVTEVTPRSQPLTAEEKATIGENTRSKLRPATVKRGAAKGQPKTYRVFDQGKWVTLPKFENAPSR